MKNTTDITNVSDRVLDAFLEAKGNKDHSVDCDDWMITEKRQLGELMGWDFNKSYVRLWVYGC